MSPVDPISPCMRCGACCASLRVAFYWTEADDATPGGVPAELTEPVPPHFLAMRGTNQAEPRCVALDGTVGDCVHCVIYPRRSSTCRAFAASWEYGEHNPACDKARARHGLPPLRAEDWAPRDRDPEAA